MQTLDAIVARCPLPRAFDYARNIARWPEWLPHYRHVRIRGEHGDRVEMAAVRPFGPLRWPVWWESELTVEESEGRIRYRHVRGITAGMDVEWRLEPDQEGTRITVVHTWERPWLGGWLANAVVGPVFIRGVVSRTLAGLKHQMEKG